MNALGVPELDRILSEVVPPGGVEEVELSRAAGRVLAAPVHADRDIPPYDRVCMDGFALGWDDWAAGRRSYAVAGLAPAGAERGAPLRSGTCLEVTTGSAAPIGCDLVVRVEDSRGSEGSVVLDPDPVVRGQNLHWRGSDARAGAELLAEGTFLGAPEVGVLASVGRTWVPVRSLPRIAVCSTGSELVDVGSAPLPHQVRRSNDRFAQALLEGHGLPVAGLHPLPDDRNALLSGISRMLGTHDVAILSGGVSASRVDLVPEVLRDLGVEFLVHGVAQKPGKPFLAGIGPRGQFVAALPGNPVAAAVCLRRHVLPVLYRMTGRRLTARVVRLDHPQERLERSTRFPACRVRTGEAGSQAARVASGNGSGDFLHLVGTDGLLEIPAGQGPLDPGAPVEFHPW